MCMKHVGCIYTEDPVVLYLSYTLNEMLYSRTPALFKHPIVHYTLWQIKDQYH